ncbi:MAG: phosphatase PAP2 family protein [Marinilabiliaceae bacterium]|nr:phosphatase PAP2 family protein [Marinilabiliaceae bacterium]
MADLKKIDVLFLIYLAISTLTLAFAWDSSIHSPAFIWIRCIMVASILALIYADKKSTHALVKLLRLSYPILLSGYFYSETVFYNKIFFNDLDPLLIDIETALFNMQPSLEFAAYFSNKLVSELMYFGYFSFYLLILGFTLYVFIKKRVFFKQVTFLLSASLYLFYLTFCFFPSAGPQFYFSPPESVLPEAYFFSHVMHFIQHVGEQPTGAFPSSHVGISVIILMLSKKYAPPFFKFAWPLVIILIISTVYIKAHYAIDSIAGLMVAPFILYLSGFLYHLPRWKNQK